MLLKILFREYDYENGIQHNTISTNKGSALVTGNLSPAGGFNFHLIPVGARIEVEISQGVSKYIGNVKSITDSSHLTMDREVDETYHDKIYWVDWTLFYLTVGTLSRKVESDDPGKAGLICFDSVDMSFFFGESITQAGIILENPVLSAFAGSIDNKKRFLIRLQAVKWDFFEEEQKLITHTGDFLIDHLGNYLSANYRDFQSRTLFEGMIDFTTKQHPEVRYDGVEELVQEVEFEVIDKLSALAIIDSGSNQRGDQLTAWDRVPGNYNWENCMCSIKNFIPLAYLEGEIILLASSDGTNPDDVVVISTVYGNTGVPHTEPILKKGETFLIWDVMAQQYHKHLVLDSGLCQAPDMSPTWLTTWVRLYPSNVSYQGEYAEIMTPKLLLYYDKNYYGVDDIGIYSTDDHGRTVLSALNVIKIIEAIVKQRWPDVFVINNLVDVEGNTLTEYPVPLNFFEDMTDELPLGKEPLDALTYLANGIMIYIFFDSNGNFVLQNKNRFQVGNEKIIPADYLDAFTKKDFWDKLVDAVTVKAYYWKTDLSGEGTVQKQDKAKPRNSKTFEVFVDGYWLNQFGMSVAANGDLVFPAHPEYTQQQIINEYAYLLAEKQFGYYGKRHESLDFQLNKLDWNVIKWDLLNTFLYNNRKYFTTNINMDLIENTLQMEIPSEEGYNYNINNVLIRSSN